MMKKKIKIKKFKTSKRHKRNPTYYNGRNEKLQTQSSGVLSRTNNEAILIL